MLLNPLSVSAKQIDYVKLLKKNHVKIINAPVDPEIIRLTYEVFKEIPHVKTVSIVYKPTVFLCGTVPAVGCYHNNTKTIEIISNVGSYDAYKYVLAHEYGHRFYQDKASGITVECRADAFAKKMFPESVGTYNCN